MEKILGVKPNPNPKDKAQYLKILTPAISRVQPLDL